MMASICMLGHPCSASHQSARARSPIICQSVNYTGKAVEELRTANKYQKKVGPRTHAPAPMLACGGRVVCIVQPLSSSYPFWGCRVRVQVRKKMCCVICLILVIVAIIAIPLISSSQSRTRRALALTAPTKRARHALQPLHAAGTNDDVPHPIGADVGAGGAPARSTDEGGSTMAKATLTRYDGLPSAR